MSEIDNTIEIRTALAFPKGKVKKVAPKLVHQNKVYAHELAFGTQNGITILADVRQAPIDVTEIKGQYGELGAYITEFEKVSLKPLKEETFPCQYLGLQMSLVFFQNLMDRYYKLIHQGDDAHEGELDDVDEFQEYYAEVLSAYHPLGFPLGAYEHEPMINTAFGAFLLGAKATEQMEAVAKPGDTVYISPLTFSFASWKKLPKPFSFF